MKYKLLNSEQRCAISALLQRQANLAILFVLMMGLSLFSCTKEGNTIYVDDVVENDSLPVVYFLSREGYLGDLGYVDAIYNGAVKGVSKGNMKLSINELPSDDAQAVTKFRSILNSLKNENANSRKLMVIANDNLEPILHQCEDDIKNADGVDILLGETNDTTLSVYTFRMPQYGIYYQAGMVIGCDWYRYGKILIANANPTDQPIKEMRDGFMQAIEDSKKVDPSSQLQIENRYMSETTGGYNMPDSAYRLSYEVSDYTLILPLCGETAQGFLRYSREHPLAFSVIGVDYDMSDYAVGTPLSVVKHIDNVVEQWITKWGEGASQERHQTYGLASGYSEIVGSELYPESPEMAKKYYQTALEKEEAYEKNK